MKSSIKSEIDNEVLEDFLELEKNYRNGNITRENYDQKLKSLTENMNLVMVLKVLLKVSKKMNERDEKKDNVM